MAAMGVICLLDINKTGNATMNNNLSEQDVTDLFNGTILASVIAHYGLDDKVAIRTAFNDWTDAMCKDGQITEDQYENYCYLGTNGNTPPVEIWDRELAAMEAYDNTEAY